MALGTQYSRAGPGALHRTTAYARRGVVHPALSAERELGSARHAPEGLAHHDHVKRPDDNG